MAHSIQRVQVSELLDGRTFVIPSYQRGYRWTGKQVGELLKDLFTYIYDMDDGGYYCLQPVIAKGIAENVGADGRQRAIGKWELVDGQQRVTTLIILLKALLAIERMDEDTLVADYQGKRLMRLEFETRDADTEFLENIADKGPGDCNGVNQEHMYSAYDEIIRWFSDDALRLAKERNHRRPGSVPESLRKLAESFIDILVLDNAAKSVHIIWYELDDDPRVNPIREFLRINSGKIPLTDAELVKALLLQRSNFKMNEAQQIQHAFQWEQMENRLMEPDFWGMLSNVAGDYDRMHVVLDMIYRAENNGQVAAEKGDMFRYFAGVVEIGADPEERCRAVDGLWNRIVTKCRLLETWFGDSLVYNYVGLLVHYGESIYSVMKLYDELPDDAKREDFLRKLVDAVKRHLTSIRQKELGAGLSYARHKKDIEKLLLFVNVQQFNCRIAEQELNPEYIGRDGGFFKFPFALYDGQNWNVEHIDSFTANDLRRPDDQRAWIASARACYPELRNDAVANELEQAGELMGLIAHIQNIYDGDDDDEPVKNGIGNLALLDEVTNKGYGNHVFAIKQKVVRERVHKGIFVPICTQWVFSKEIPGIATRQSLKWSHEDKEAYREFLLAEVNEFLDKEGI